MKTLCVSPDQCGSVGQASSGKAKAHGLNSQSEHKPGLPVQSPVGACMRATDGCFSPFLSPSPSLKINKIFNFLNMFYLFLERGREKERETNSGLREIHWSVASHMPSTGDLACNPGMCPDWESNQWPFGSQTGTQSTEPHQPGYK